MTQLIYIQLAFLFFLFWTSPLPNYLSILLILTAYVVPIIFQISSLRKYNHNISLPFVIIYNKRLPLVTFLDIYDKKTLVLSPLRKRGHYTGCKQLSYLSFPSFVSFRQLWREGAAWGPRDRWAVTSFFEFNNLNNLGSPDYKKRYPYNLYCLLYSFRLYLLLPFHQTPIVWNSINSSLLNEMLSLSMVSFSLHLFPHRPQNAILSRGRDGHVHFFLLNA